MHKKLLFVILGLLAMAGIQGVWAAPQADAAPGVIRVKLQPEVAVQIAKLPQTASTGIQPTGVTQFDRANVKAKAYSITRLIPYSPKFEARHHAAGLDLWYEIRFDEKAIRPSEARNLYSAVPGIQIAENVRPMTLIGDGEPRPLTSAEMAKAMAGSREGMPFNDPLLGDQWHYHNDGLKLAGSVAGADANIWEAWKTETGKKDVMVAIIDGGFQLDHPDLVDNAFVNLAELNGTPGVDDDGNGYVDDIYGWNFVINSDDVSAHSHGTHVAGTVGAVNNNGIGVAGVAGGDGNGGVTMLRCQVFDHRASAEANYAGALVYAADMGASIAQCSWGWSDPDYYEQSVLDAIDYFTTYGGGDKMSGGLCIFANGNTGMEGNYYPACYEKVVAVGALDPMLHPASYSSHGDWVDITAPGGDTDFGERYGVLSTLPNGTYGYMNGTSMACPHVSGIAALVLSKYGSPTFTNENLRMQLLSSVNDFYTRNPDVVGKYGSGYIDGYKALQMGTGEAPAAVADFTLTPSQDNVLIEWTIPDTPEKSVDHHIIYYSTSPFDASTDLRTLRSVNVDTKFYLSGDAMSYEINGLTPTTTYYVAMIAVNRYGNASALSAVKSATTNEGPRVAFDKTDLNLDVDATAGSVAADQFTIANEGLGMLKYTLSAATVGSQIAASSRVPSPGRIASAPAHLSAKSVSHYPVVTADYQKEDYPIDFAYSPECHLYIGESDLNVPNALAQYFYVDPAEYPDGFNLTGLLFGGAGGENPVIEIYDGASTISRASLLQTVEYDFWMYRWTLNLQEQMFFAPGTAFWVVAKFPAGQGNPLGAGKTTDATHKNYAFYSSDDGETWMQLSEVLRDGNLADQADQLNWAVTALSANPDWSSVLNPQPIEGSVRPGESQVVTVENDGQKMVNGSYVFNLYVNSNQTDHPKQKVTVNMAVNGNKPSLTSTKMVDFGNILVGEEKSLEVEIANVGYGHFGDEWGYMQSSTISCDSPEFEVPGFAEGIPARSKSTLKVTFKPSRSGSHSGTVTLTSKDGVKHSFVVRGMAAMPAKAVVEVDSYDFGDLEVGGEAKTATFTVKNEGEYPLQYVFPKFSDETIEGAGEVHKYGYSYISNLEGAEDFAYDGNPALPNETVITSQFNANSWITAKPVDLGFKFPFYGEEYTQVYITAHGAVTMQTKDGRIESMVPEAKYVYGLGYVSAYANSGWLEFGANSKISYGNLQGKFYVKYENVITGSAEGGNQEISFHMALCPDGSVEVYYDNFDPYSVWGGGMNNYIGVCDIDAADPFTVTDYDYAERNQNYLCLSIMSGSAIKILAPAKSMVSSLSSTDGVIGIGESKQIAVTVKAEEGQYAGSLTNVLTMVTNDPFTPGVNFTLSANIVGESLRPQAVVAVDQLDFGQVFRTSVASKPILLNNNGTDKLVVSSATVKGGNFTLGEEVASQFVVEPGTGKDIFVTLPTETEGAVEDVVEITFADTAIAPISIPVKGQVIGAPEWSIDTEVLEAETEYGEDVEKTVTVTNTGNEDLQFTIAPNDLAIIGDLNTDANSSLDYVYKSATDYSDVTYNWIDLVGDPDAEHQDLTYYLDKTDFYTVELPFDFTFYGKTYRKMYIYNTGFVSFSEHTDYKMFPEPPAQLPTSETFYTNIIAPFWGNHAMGSADEDGTYYKAYDDHVVVSFISYGNSVTLGLDYQLILNADGSFKFQYHLQPDGLMIGVFGIGGVQDENGVRGINLPDNTMQPGNAVEFYPTKSYTVARDGGSVEIPVVLKADKMADVYQSALVFNTNVPTQPVVELPISLTINGEVMPIFPEMVGGEQVTDPIEMPTVVYEFEVANEGTRALHITRIDFNNAGGGEPGFPDDGWDDLLDFDDDIDPGMGVGGGGDMPAQLMAYTDVPDYWTGQITKGWAPYMPGMEFLVGKEPQKFQIHVMDMGEEAMYQDWITFWVELDGEEIPVQVPFVAMFTPAPAMTFDKPAIEFSNVPAEFTGSDKVTISNDGEWTLRYSLHLDPTGKGEEPEEPDYGIGNDFPDWGPLSMNVPAAPLSADELKDFVAKNTTVVPAQKFEGFVWDVPDMECSNLLYYPILDVDNPSGVIIGTGSNLDDNFLAATRYVAPEEGFNLTHLYFVGTVGPLENVDIEASVIGSSDVTSDRVIGHGKIRVESEAPVQGNYYGGRARMIEFDKPVYINPNETFYVVVKYPAGYGASAVMSAKKEKVREGRYLGWLRGYGWMDLGTELESQYSSMGYFMTCVEETPGKPWITLSPDTELEGELEPGDEAVITVNVDAESAYFDEFNQAVIVIKSNDPAQKLVNYPVILSKNAAPQVLAPDGTFTVAEGSTAELPLTVIDTESDAFTVRLNEVDGIAKVKSFTTGNPDIEATETDGTIAVPAGQMLSLTVELAPDYGTAGLHTFDVVTEDANGNYRSTALTYHVEHVNRAPEYAGPTTLTIGEGETTTAFDYASLFSDPDGDALTYSVAVKDSRVVAIYASETGFVLLGASEGKTSVSLTATDTYGVKTVATIAVTVSTQTGIDGVTADNGSVTVATDKDKAIVTTSVAAHNADYRIYDANGRLVAQLAATDLAAGDASTIVLGDAPSVYVLVATLDGTTSVVKFVKD